MRAKTRWIFTVALLFALGMSAPVAAVADADAGAKPPAQKQALPLDQLRTFVEIMNRIEEDYVKPVDDKEMLTNAIRGMIDGLDPHSAYLDPKEYRQMTIDTRGRFGGLGIEVDSHNGFIRVVSPIDDTPASRAGIKAGDLIVRINGKPVKGLDVTKMIDRLRGDPGSRVTLTIVRKGRPKPFDLHLKRAVIKVQSVKSHLIEPNYGYVRITEFSSESGDELQKQLHSLGEHNHHPLKGLILDLRNNPGGVLDAAVDVSNAFLDGGQVVSIKGRTPQSNHIFSATSGDQLNGAPIVVLINGGTASAAEIVSGALQDHHRALIVGTRSFGKGSVQTLMPLQNGAAIKLTTARYYTPDGRSIQAEGIEPDIVMPQLSVSSSRQSVVDELKENDLLGSLKNDTNSEQTVNATDKQRARIADKEADLAKKDYQLYQGLNLLKGLVIARADR